MKVFSLFKPLAGAVSMAVLFTAITADAQVTAPATDSTMPSRWLLLCCGLPGDGGHRERLTEACQKVIAGAQAVLDVPPEQLRILAGDDEMREALAGSANEVGVCTKESVAESLQELSEKVPPTGGCWVVLLGHAHLYDSSSQFNILGPDFDQVQFAEWAKPINCREQVFWLTMPLSGFWTKPLASESRVIVSATEADLEFTGTEMPYALSDVLVGEGEHQDLEDVDQDGTLSLLDLYLSTNLEIHGRFESLERLQTEHAQLEDNGDGRGSELQQDYLPSDEDEPSDEDKPAEEESAEEKTTEDASANGDAVVAEVAPTEAETTPKVRRTLPKPISNANLDGFRSRHIKLRKPE